MKAAIPYGRQDISEADIDAVVGVLRSSFLTQGPAIDQFEQVVARYVGGEYATAVSSATAALHIACQALGLGPGDHLWTVPNTFVASANCARYCGATVDFIDIDRDTYNMSVVALEQKLAEAKRDGVLPKIVIPVHFAGQSCDMAAIGALALQYGFAVIEDASHAIGATYDNAFVGNCRYSDITVFSFHPVKIITSGEGGMALTNNAALHARMQRLRSHGITRNAAEMRSRDEGSWYYEQLELGYNYRMTDIQAALGSSQMTRLPAFVDRRRTLAARYNQAFSTSKWHASVRISAQKSYGISAWHLYPIHVANRRAVFDSLREAGILVNVHYIPVHLQPYYGAMGFKRGDFPNAEWYYDGAISLPMYFGLSDATQDYVISAVAAAVGEATRMTS